MSVPPAPAAFDATALTSHLTDTNRLYRLQGEDVLSQLLVESWRQQEALDTPWRMQIDALSTDPRLDIHAMLGLPLALITRLSDGSEYSRAGVVTVATGGAVQLARRQRHPRAQPLLAHPGIHCGINNLPRELSARIAQTLQRPDPPRQGGRPPPLMDSWDASWGESLDAPWGDAFADPFLQPEPPIEVPPEVLAQAAERGYANHFEAIRAAIPWRPEATGCSQPPPYPGMLTATVIGADGQTRASGADAIHMDRWGRSARPRSHPFGGCAESLLRDMIGSMHSPE